MKEKIKAVTTVSIGVIGFVIASYMTVSITLYNVSDDRMTEEEVKVMWQEEPGRYYKTILSPRNITNVFK